MKIVFDFDDFPPIFLGGTPLNYRFLWRNSISNWTLVWVAASYEVKGKWLFFGLITFGYAAWATGNLWCWLSRDVLSAKTLSPYLFLGTIKTTLGTKEVAKINVAVFWEPLYMMGKEKSDHEKGANKNWPILATKFFANVQSTKNHVAHQPLVENQRFPIFQVKQILDFLQNSIQFKNCLIF